MITIFQGTQAQIKEHFQQLPQKSTAVITLNYVDSFPSGWQGVRQLIHEVKIQFDEQKVAKILHQHQVACKFLYPELSFSLTKEEQFQFDRYKARFESRLNIPNALFKAISHLLESITTAFSFSLYLPDITKIDAETLRVLETYYRLHENPTLHTYLPFATDLADKSDAIGITWDRSSPFVQEFTTGLKLHPTTLVLELSETNKTIGTKRFSPSNPLTNTEKETYEGLSLPLDNKQVKETVKMLEIAYQRYSYRAVIKIGLKLLELRPDLPAPLASTIHGLVGSAANFYQFSHFANPPFDDFLVLHFEKALKEEKIPANRSALLYRIAFAYAERHDNFEKAEFWAKQAVLEAEQGELSSMQRDYHLGWALNVSGHIAAFKGRMDEALTAGERAYKLLIEGRDKLAKANDPALGHWLDDYKFSLYNLAIHQVYTGEELDKPDYSRSWFDRMMAVVNTMPRDFLFDTFHWVDYHRNKLTLKVALEAAESGIKDATHYKHSHIYIYQVCAADLCYRIGNIDRALELATQAKQTKPLYNDMFRDFSPSWLMSNAYLRQGHLEKAVATIKTEFEKEDTLAGKIKLQTVLIKITAQRKERGNLEKQINQLVDWAVELGEQNLLLHAAATAGHALLTTDDINAAKDAFNQALELVNSLLDEGNTLNSAYLLDTYLGYMLVNGYDESLTANIILQIPQALDDMESWWKLANIVPFVDLLVQSKSQHLENPALQEALKIFALASEERVDGRKREATV